MIYAKSEPIETLREHTDNLLEQLEILKNSYRHNLEKVIPIDSKEFWKLLDIVVEFHDLGKVFTPFQNVIREKIGMSKIDTGFENDIPHNYLSPAYISFKNINIDDEEERKMIIQAIGYHHERDMVIDGDAKTLIDDVINNDLINGVDELKVQTRYPIKEKKLNAAYLKKLENRITQRDNNYFTYILLKGLLHKLDHSASGHCAIEVDFDKYIGDYTNRFINENYGGLREVQNFAVKNKDKNIILIASTGMGKTETALLWIDKDKAFFTLPLRVSINAIFERVTKEIDANQGEKGINYPFAGLLHSTSIDYLQEKNYEGWEAVYDLSKQLSKKLTFSTIDQIFKFPLKFKGYEKIYATLAYSKVVIDEIQAYSPRIAAVLVKGLEMIHKIGGKFMVMTATMPTIYIDELKKRGVFDKNLVMAEYNTDKERHRICLRENPIISDIDEIIENAENKKVLVIMNTVKGAVELYKNLCERELEHKKTINKNLLHSMYIQEDRSILEEEIKKFAKGDKNGIWITTQLVEASLDVDFDILYTELSTLDSAFQRFGRCNRKGKKPIKDVNINIYTKGIKGIGTIYDKDLYNISFEMLKEFLNGNPDGVIKEEKKVRLVEELYSISKLKDTEFFRTFKQSLEYLDNMADGELSSKEAQGILRDIDSCTVIPREIYDDIFQSLIDEYIGLRDELENAYKTGDKKLQKDTNEKRKEIRRKINKKTVNIPGYKAKDNTSPINVKGLEDLRILEYKYEFDKDESEGKFTGKGVLFGEELDHCI